MTDAAENSLDKRLRECLRPQLAPPVDKHMSIISSLEKREHCKCTGSHSALNACQRVELSPSVVTDLPEMSS